MKKLSILLALSLALVGAVSAQSVSGTVSTDPVGYMSFTCSGSSDTFVSIPFNRPAAFVGTVSSVSGGVVTISGTPGFTTNQFVYSGSTQPNSYFALLTSGSSTNPKDGSIYPISANDAQTVTLGLNGDSITNVPAGAQITIVPQWTLASAFPATDAGNSFTATTSLRSIATSILIPDYSGTGINLAPSVAYYFYQGKWVQAGTDPSIDRGANVLPTHGYFVVRNPVNFPTTKFTVAGTVPMKRHMFPLATLAAGSQDNPVSLTRPVDVTLNNSGLIQSGAFTPTVSLRSRADTLLVYDNSQTGINRATMLGAWIRHQVQMLVPLR